MAWNHHLESVWKLGRDKTCKKAVKANKVYNYSLTFDGQNERENRMQILWSGAAEEEIACINYIQKMSSNHENSVESHQEKLHCGEMWEIRESKGRVLMG